jgi:hypothetical protein
MEEELYPGAVIVANVLRVLAWIVFVGGLIAAVALAMIYDCAETAFESCPNEAGVRFGLLFGVGAGSSLYALMIWAVSYAVLLLREIESNTRPEEEEEE